MRLVVLTTLLTMACVRNEPKPAPAQAPEPPRPRSGIRVEIPRAEPQERLAARRERELREMCDRTRPEREEHMKKRMASIDHKDGLVQWEAEHCKMVDNSKAVVRIKQDKRGEFHAVEGRDRGVDTVCDEKKPAELDNTRATWIPLYDMPTGLHEMECQRLDKEVSDVARAYWAR